MFHRFKRYHQNLLDYSDKAKDKVSFIRRIKNLSNGKKIFIIILTVTVVIVAIICLVISPKIILEYKYNWAVESFNEKNYDEAINVFKQNPEYKNSKGYLSNEEVYSEAISCISKGNNDAAIKLFESIEQYKDSNKLIESQKQYIEQYKIEKENIDKAYALFCTHDYTNPNFPSSILSLVGHFNGYKSSLKEDAKIIYTYAKTHILIKGYWDSGTSVKEHDQYMDVNKENYRKVISIINPESKGSGYKDMKDIMEGIEAGTNNIFEISNSEWVALYNKDDSVGKEPQIGISANQVTFSSWGKPEKINKTTTANSIYEQWIYPNNKYIYLENGIVTTIQE